MYYLSAVIVLVGGASYAAVPLYRMFCQVGDVLVFYERLGRRLVENSRWGELMFWKKTKGVRKGENVKPVALCEG